MRSICIKHNEISMSATRRQFNGFRRFQDGGAHRRTHPAGHEGDKTIPQLHGRRCLASRADSCEGSHASTCARPHESSGSRSAFQQQSPAAFAGGITGTKRSVPRAGSRRDWVNVNCGQFKYPYRTMQTTMMYCIKCRGKTGGSPPQEKTVRGNRRMLTSKCTKCGTKKCQFVSAKKN
jgi:hypothetical protein